MVLNGLCTNGILESKPKHRGDPSELADVWTTGSHQSSSCWLCSVHNLYDLQSTKTIIF